MNLEKLKDRLRESEGSRLKAYYDTVGVLTVGIGHNCKARPVVGVVATGDCITKEQEQELFESDIADTIAQLDEDLPWWRTLDDVRQNVVVDMCFNMGISTLCTFVNTLQAIEEGRYADAVLGMKRSRWARQVGNRAVILQKMMETGEWE